MWKEAPAEVRQKYIDEEATKREAYKAAIASWRAANQVKQQERQEVANFTAEGAGHSPEMQSVADTSRSCCSHLDSLTLQQQQQSSFISERRMPESYFPYLQSPNTCIFPVASFWPSYQYHQDERGMNEIMRRYGLVRSANLWSKSANVIPPSHE
jgi:hypothetical protein